MGEGPPVRAGMEAVTTGRPATTAPALPRKAERFRMVDSLRGLAALWVATFHFYQSGLHDKLVAVTPPVVGGLLAHGYLGVQVFFVISGMVIAYSVGDARVTPAYLGRFALRRSLRLDPPYWAVILLFVTARWTASAVGHPIGPIPSSQQVLANVLYVQNILSQGDILMVFWTLCLEVQFYVVLVLLLGFAQRVPRETGGRVRQGLIALPFVAFFAVSFAQMAPGPPPRTWFLGYWYLFFLGALTCWTLRGLVPRAALAVTVALVLLGSALGGGAEPLVGVLAVTFLYFAGVRGKLSTWLDWRPLQYLERLSYSLYLLHVVTGGMLVPMGWKRWGGSPGQAVVWFVAGVTVSVLCADVFYRAVERPSMMFSKRIRMDRTTESPSDELARA